MSDDIEKIETTEEVAKSLRAQRRDLARAKREEIRRRAWSLREKRRSERGAETKERPE